MQMNKVFLNQSQYANDSHFCRRFRPAHIVGFLDLFDLFQEIACLSVGLTYMQGGIFDKYL